MAGGLSGFGAQAAGTSSISGVAFQDMNRNGVQDAGEAAFSGHQLYLFDGAGAYVGYRTTGSDGRYSFASLADGTYSVQVATATWTAVRDAWVPTIGSVVPKRTVQVAGAATQDFAWRPVVRSTTLGEPMTSYTGPTGLRTESYNDVVSASSIHDAITAGSLVGAEASSILVRFGYGSTDTTTTGASQSGGRYTYYSAAVYVTYSSWLETGERTLFHEYGHAWSQYYYYLVQQDPSLAGYLAARGLTGDSRVNNSYGWSPDEMIAEDYRQLFGSASAAAAMQMNPDIPKAADVAGLREYLRDTFRTAPSGSAPAPAPGGSVSDVAVTPTKVSKSGTVSFTLSGPATVDVEILDSKGTVVRSLLRAAGRPAGTSSVVWDRKNAAGQRVRAGAYTAVVRATAGGSAQSSSTFAFSVV